VLRRGERYCLIATLRSDGSGSVVSTANSIETLKAFACSPGAIKDLSPIVAGWSIYETKDVLERIGLVQNPFPATPGNQRALLN